MSATKAATLRKLPGRMRRKATFYPVAGSFQGARVVLEAIGRDEQEAINKLEGLLLRFRDEEGGG